MSVAFGSGDAEEIIATVSDDTQWIYHGTQINPADVFETKEGMRAFVNDIFGKTEDVRLESR